MPDVRAVHRWRRCDAVTAWRIVAQIADDLGQWSDADLRLVVRASDAVEFVLPQWSEATGLTPQQYQELLRRMGSAFIRSAGDGGDGAVPALVTLDLSPLPRLSSAVFVLFDVLAAQRQSVARKRTSVGRQSLLAVFDGAAEVVGRKVALLVKRARDVRVQVARPSGEERVVVLALYADDAAEGATYGGLVAARAEEAPDAVLAAHGTPAGTVYVSADRAPSDEDVRLLGAILAGVRRAGFLPASTDDVAVVGGALTGWRVYQLGRSFRPAADLLVDLDPRQPLRIEVVQLEPADDALADLGDRLTDPGFPIGYRVRLERVPHRMSAHQDPAPMREQIEQLETQIAIISALGARQQRLLRFSDAQLPALVDVLRRLPRALLKGGVLRYAASHIAGRSGPAHYVLYDPLEASVHGFFAETYWRGRTEDRPMMYWLDPFCAEARSARDVASSVFTPTGTALAPALTSFGGDVDSTLRLLFGRSFQYATNVLADPGAEPLFVFTPSPAADVELEVELLDTRSFAPLSLSPRWINHYMAVRNPRFVDEEQAASLAEGLYAGPLAEDLQTGGEDQLQRVAVAWADAEQSIIADLDGLTERLTQELEAYGSRLGRTLDFLETTARRIAQIERNLRSADARLRFGHQAFRRTEVAADTMEARYEAFGYKMQREADAANELMDRARREVEALRQRARELERTARARR